MTVSSGTLAHYQKLMSKAIWRPAFGRKLGFLIVQDTALLGLLFLASPVIRLSARDTYLGITEDYGTAMKSYMDVSVCVAAQPIGWHWNLGKLMAMIAPTLGDYVTARYGGDFKGVTTTSLYGGKLTQYSRIYEYLGETKGHGHAHVSDERYGEMMAYLRSRCPHCTPGCANPLEPEATRTQLQDRIPKSEWCVIPGSKWRKGCGDGANPRMRRIAKYLKVTGTPKSILSLTHGALRGVYYHPAVPSNRRPEVIQTWYGRWGLPRYLKTKDQQPPYQNGLDGKPDPATIGGQISSGKSRPRSQKNWALAFDPPLTEPGPAVVRVE
jgi:Domain of unknown function (DUF4338)